MEENINNSTILQDDDGAIFMNNSEYDIIIPSGTTVYPCMLCEKVFKSLEDLANHREGICT